MKRRSFLQALLGLAAAPAAAMLPAAAPAFVIGVDPAGVDATVIGIFKGGLGRWNDVRFYEGTQWTPEQINALRAVEAPPLALNKIRTTLAGGVDVSTMRSRASAQLRNEGFAWA